MTFEVTGKLIVKQDTQQIKESFKKREFVLELSEDINGSVYTNYAKMQLVQAKCDLLDKFEIGEQIKVYFNIRGNRWERDGNVNYITNLDAWRIEPATGEQQPTTQVTGGYTTPAPVNGSNAGPSGNFYNPSPESADDLPF